MSGVASARLLLVTVLVTLATSCGGAAPDPASGSVATVASDDEPGAWVAPPPPPEVALAGVAGRAVDAEGRAVEGAVVRLESWVREYDGEDAAWSRSFPLASARTGPDGRFAFGPLTSRGQALRVTVLDQRPEPPARGGARADAADLVPGGLVDLGDVALRSTPHGFAVLRVRVRSGGQPVAGAQVDLGFWCSDTGLSDMGTNSLATDAAGEASLDLCASGVRVSVAAAGFATEERAVERVQREDVTLDVELARAGVARGRVVDADGRGVKTWVEAREAGPPGRGTPAITSATCDADGRFALPELALGRRYVLAAGGFLRREETPVDALPVEVTAPADEVLLRLVPTGTLVVGRIDEAGAAQDVGQAFLERLDEATGTWRPVEVGGCRRGSTGQKALTFPVVPGRYRALCLGDGTEPTCTAALAVRPGETVSTTVRALPGRSVRGALVAPDGAPPPGTRIGFEVGPWCFDLVSGDLFVGAAHVWQDGTFTMPGLPTGDVRLHVVAQGCEPLTIDLPAGAPTDLGTLTLEHSGRRPAGR